MGTYLNPGKELFARALNSDIYVDKTEMILFLNSIINTEKMYVSTSRPRRFGKSMAVNMLCAYYGRECESRALFEGRKISGYERWDASLGKYDVIRLNIIDFLADSHNVADMLSYLTEEVTEELKEAHPDISYGSRQNLRNVCAKIHAATGNRFIILIDEWDAVFREWREDKKGQERYLDFLRDWLKDKPYVALAYMTGILPIKKYGKHSALNMFDEYSMTSPLQMAPYTGFTEEEVRGLCREYDMPYEGISDWYDGYVVRGTVPVEKRELYRQGKYDGNRISIYSPLSVINAVSTGQIRNYWNKTENYEALADYIRMDFDGLKEAVAVLMDGGRVPVDIRRFQNDMTSFADRDDILSLLIHLGYLGYDEEEREVFIPNKEILDEFKTSTGGNEWLPVFESFRSSQRLLEATWKKDAATVAALLEAAHDKAANQTYSSEAALNYAVRYAYYAAQKYYTILPEMDTGKGYADVTFIPSPGHPEKPALVVELKYEKDAETGLDQIRARNYPERLAHYKGNILLVCVSYEKEAKSGRPDFKRHACVIEDA